MERYAYEYAQAYVPVIRPSCTSISIATRGYVLETGKISLTGTGAELMASDAVRKAYLGG